MRSLVRRVKFVAFGRMPLVVRIEERRPTYMRQASDDRQRPGFGLEIDWSLVEK